MKREFIKAYNKLKKMGAPVFKEYSNGRPIEGGRFKISAEDNHDEPWADYYMEFGINGDSNTPGLNKKICDVLEEFGLHAEWDNPGSLTVYH